MFLDFFIPVFLHSRTTCQSSEIKEKGCVISPDNGSKVGLKAQKLLAQGIALGIMAISKTPCKGKSFVYCLVF